MRRQATAGSLQTTAVVLIKSKGPRALRAACGPEICCCQDMGDFLRHDNASGSTSQRLVSCDLHRPPERRVSEKRRASGRQPDVSTTRARRAYATTLARES